MKGGISIVTIRDVARIAGVSTTTVSHVINETRFVSERLRKRVNQAIRELHYNPYGLARSLRTKQTKTIGMIIPDNSNPFFAEVARAVEDACFQNRYNVIMCNSDGDPQKELNYLRLLIEKGVDGLAFISAGNDRQAIDILTGQEIAWVVADREIAGVQTDTVLVDNFSGGYQATRYLLSLGHRRIGCITGPSQLTPSALRLTGYRQALDEAGIACNDRLIVGGDFQSVAGYRAAHALLLGSDRPTAIFACNDLMAIGAMFAAYELRIRIPRQLSIVGFDDISLCSFTTPRLTTVAQPKYEMGRMVTNMLVRRIADRSLAPRREILETKLIIRDSCAPSPGARTGKKSTLSTTAA